MTNLPWTFMSSMAKALLIATLFIPNLTLGMTSLPAEIEKGWRRAVHVLGTTPPRPLRPPPCYFLFHSQKTNRHLAREINNQIRHVKKWWIIVEVVFVWPAKSMCPHACHFAFGMEMFKSCVYADLVVLVIALR